MKFRKDGNTVVLRVEKGEDVNTCIEKVAEELNLGFCSVSAIGSVCNSCLAYVGQNGTVKKEIPHRREMMALGNISLKDEKRFAHIHAWLSDENMAVCSGHLVKAEVAITCEVVIAAAKKEVKRKQDLAVNYMVLDL